jgi:formate transporter
MPYIKPDAVVENMIQAGTSKAKLAVRDLLIRGILSGALLGFATTLALTAAAQTGLGIVGALIFPVGFVMIVLLGLELVTGNFALVPLGVMDGKISMGSLWFNWSWVFLGNLIGGVLNAILFARTLTPAAPLTKLLVAASEAKTLGYAKLGYAGLMSAFVKAILCNWMVTMGVVMSLTSQSTVGKIVAMWLPILTFFAQGFEHSVVNMFVIPAGMILGSQVSFSDWWLWNQVPVTLGNIFGGFVFTGFALYMTYRI